MEVTALDLLQCCRSAARERRQLETLLQRCLSDGSPHGVRTQQFPADPPGTNAPGAAAVQQYDGLSARLMALDAEWARLCAAGWSIIQPVGRPRKLLILTRYYLQGETDREIAEAQGLSREHVTRLRHEALHDLKVLQ